ncbi:MAG: cytochrome B [Rhodobacteraceae bacterium CG17_big_fil_post_rev_8_21_14_2_50_63_15]|nr:cytochrome B [Roseovarius sp.]PIV79192.1 MAG: cytochrome B [Rhodobacteraceae bacterium CG17_big_fil_post_rev_8_21_14_2_50_63_15]
MTRIWDPLIRIFHWSLVAAYVVAWLTADEWDRLHEISGYVIVALIAIRLVWGVVGSPYARFAQFVTGPRATLAYLADMAHWTERRYLGHNPAGAAMVLALLLTLSGTALTGWLMVEPSRLALLPEMPQILAPAWAGDEDSGEVGGKEVLKDLHEVLANLTLFLVALHVAGVLLASVRHRENLARAMLSGDKRAPEPGDIA